MNTYDKITNFIVEELEKGNIPWKKPWKSFDANTNVSNFFNKKGYRGINTLILGVAMQSFRLPFFLTFKQAGQLGGKIKKGATGYPVVFFSPIKKIDESTGKEVTFPIARNYTVFNVEQTEGIDLSKFDDYGNDDEPVIIDTIDNCEKVISNWKKCPEIRHDENRAYYSPIDDYINVPKIGQFESGEEYYSVLFHEMIHSTGHKEKLNRFTKGTRFGDNEYSKEELVAELGACFLCTDTGIDKMTVKNSVGYIQSWIKVLKNDKTLIFKASSQAQKAVDMILNREVKKGGE